MLLVGKFDCQLGRNDQLTEEDNDLELRSVHPRTVTSGDDDGKLGFEEPLLLQSKRSSADEGLATEAE